VVRGPHDALPNLLPRLYGFARTLLSDQESARDLVQEAASRALAATRVPPDPPAYRAWMFKIVRNAAVDELRRHKRPVGDPTDDHKPELWHFDDASIAKITVEQGLATLAAPYREIVALVDIAGFSYSETADLLHVPVGTVMSRITRARSALLAAIENSRVRPLQARKGARPG
jgi:RNA polymerase sigma-70 factor (ECF subfamily)